MPDTAVRSAGPALPGRAAPRRRVVGVLGWLAQVVSWFVILGVLGLLAVMVAIPRFTGATPYTVLTGSMRPTYPPGTLIVVRPVAPDEIGIGTAITYQLRSGDPTVVTHRVIAVTYGTDGETRFITQGDANSARDSAPVRVVQVRGAVWYSLPYAGHLNTYLAGEHRPLINRVIVAGLVAYALWLFGSQIRGGIQRRRADGAMDRSPTPSPSPHDLRPQPALFKEADVDDASR